MSNYSYVITSSNVVLIRLNGQQILYQSINPETSETFTAETAKVWAEKTIVEYENMLKYQAELVLRDKKNKKLKEIKEEFLKQQNETGSFVSSLGFSINATRTSKEDVSGLILLVENKKLPTVKFRDYDNNFKDLTLEQLKTLQLELVQYGTILYQHKWDIEVAIEKATSEEELKPIKW